MGITKKELTKIEKNIPNMKVKDMYNLVYDYQKEGKMGIIRFPKWLRDLHRKITGDYKSSEIIIKSQLIDILNNKHLYYCETKLSSLSSP